MLLIGFCDELVEQSPDFRKMADYLGDADDGEIFGIDHRFAADSPHAFSAYAKEFQLQCLCGDSRPRLSRGAKLRCSSIGGPMESFNQLRAVHFPGSFAGGDQNSHRAILKPSYEVQIVVSWNPLRSAWPFERLLSD